MSLILIININITSVIVNFFSNKTKKMQSSTHEFYNSNETTQITNAENDLGNRLSIFKINIHDESRLTYFND